VAKKFPGKCTPETKPYNFETCSAKQVKFRMLIS